MNIQLTKTSSKKRWLIAVSFGLGLLGIGWFLQSDNVPRVEEDKVTLVIAQPIGIAMFVLDDVVYSYACERSTMAPLTRVGSSVCRWFCC